MKHADPGRAEKLFHEALDLPPEHRAAFLDSRCAGHDGTRRQVDSLLAHYDRAPTGFLHAPTLPGSVPGEVGAPQRIGKYTVVGVIGEGGMGIVYEAQQDVPRRAVAVKVVRPGFASKATLRRFLHEAEVLGQLHHPGLACIYEAGIAELPLPGGTTSSQPYFAMELIRGERLTDYASARELKTRPRLELFVKVCEAVQYAHGKGIIHRDLKPANILVTAEGQPKVLDFGVARLTDGDVGRVTMQTRPGQLIGTLPYMSPEQVCGDSRQLDTRSDVYSLGVVLYELLTNRLPHDLTHRSIPEAIRVIKENDAKTLSSMNRRFLGDVDTIVAKAMEKEKERRYQSAAELAADVQRFLRDEPIVARRSSSLYQLRKFTKRNRALVGGTVATVVALAVGLASTASAMMKATSHAKRATHEASKAQAVNRFLHDMLTSVQPAKSLGHEITMREVLDNASGRIDRSEFGTDPQAKATLHATIGNTYRLLGELAAAEPLLRECLDIRRAVLSPTDPRIASTEGMLAEVMVTLGGFDEAERLLLSTLPGIERGAASDDEAARATRRRLERLYLAWGKPEEAARWASRLSPNPGEAAAPTASAAPSP